MLGVVNLVWKLIFTRRTRIDACESRVSIPVEAEVLQNRCKAWYDWEVGREVLELFQFIVVFHSVHPAWLLAFKPYHTSRIINFVRAAVHAAHFSSRSACASQHDVQGPIGPVPRT